MSGEGGGTHGMGMGGEENTEGMEWGWKKYEKRI